MPPPRLVHSYHSFSQSFVFPRVNSKVFNGPVWKKKVVVGVYKTMTNLEKVSTKYPISSSARTTRRRWLFPNMSVQGTLGSLRDLPDGSLLHENLVCPSKSVG